jgi:uncharacterized DUF497 family protein
VLVNLGRFDPTAASFDDPLPLSTAIALLHATMSDIVRHKDDTMRAMTARPHIARLIWDEWNRNHITKHAVRPEEAEEVIAGKPVARETYKQRVQFIGPTLAGRMLAIVVGPVPDRPGVFYVFSARPASRKERNAYAQAQGASSNGPTETDR